MNSLTVATWNIWVYGDRESEKMAELIRENDIEVIGLQEAAIYFDEEEDRNIAEEIAEELGYYYEFYPALDFRPDKPYKMGNAVISKYPIKNSKVHDLNPENVKYDGGYQTEPRIALETEIEIEDNRIKFFTTHLQYSYRFETSEIRRSQVQNLLSAVEEAELPVVLTGDFNSTLDNPEIQSIADELNKVGADEPTWTVQPFEHEGWNVTELEYRLDNIFVSSGIKCQATEVIYSELSDHLPVKAEVKMER